MLPGERPGVGPCGWIDLAGRHRDYPPRSHHDQFLAQRIRQGAESNDRFVSNAKQNVTALQAVGLCGRASRIDPSDDQSIMRAKGWAVHAKQLWDAFDLHLPASDGPRGLELRELSWDDPGVRHPVPWRLRLQCVNGNDQGQ